MNRFNPVYVHLTHVQALSFLKILVTSLGEIPQRGKDRVLQQIVNKIKSTDIKTILLIDEAHLLSTDALIDLRLLISSAVDGLNHLKIVLFGHSEIKREFKRSCHKALVQRTTIPYHIPPMTMSQTHQYIDFQMRRVHSNEKVFEEEVKKDIHEYAQGVPRLINNIATACLIIAAAENKQKVDENILTQAVKEIQLI
jgi:general secretion pathway protein A